MRNVEDRHETRLKNMNSTIDNVKLLIFAEEKEARKTSLMHKSNFGISNEIYEKASAIDNVKALMIIQEDYICWLEKQVETLSGMKIGDYFKEHPRD